MPALIVFCPDTTYTSDWSFQANHFSVWTALSKALGQATDISVNPSVDSFPPNRYCVNVATSSHAGMIMGKVLVLEFPPWVLFPFLSSASIHGMTFSFLSDTEKPSLDSLKSNLKTFLFFKNNRPAIPLHAAIFHRIKSLFTVCLSWL